jgi:tetratricopeptide (TPR) repeat protein
MRRSEPILTDPDDIRIWNKIGRIGGKEKRRKKQGDKLSVLAVIDDALTTNKQLHSAVLVAILEKASHEELSDLQDVAIKVLDMCRPGDMYPVMEAADIVVKDGNLDVVSSLMKRLVNVPDTAFREYLEGMIASKSKEYGIAMEHLIRSNAIDQSLIRTYDALISLNPNRGWDVLRNISLIMSGEPKREVHTDDADLLELQEIYDGWYKGDRGNARKRLESSSGFSSGHLDFILAAARITGDVEEFDTSLELYDRILDEYPSIDSIIVEKANILTAMGKRNDALAIIETLDKESMNNRNITETMLRTLASRDTKNEFVLHQKNFLKSEHGDKGAHLFVCNLMSKMGMNDDADIILKMLTSMFPEDLEVLLAYAMNELLLEKYTSALKIADRIVKVSPKTSDGYRIRAEIHLKYGRMKNALRDGLRALRFDPDNIDSLIVVKDVRMRSGEYDESLELCRRILILNPSDAEAMKDMAYSLDMLGRRQEAIEEYKNALHAKKDAKMMIFVLSSLIEGDRAADAASIAKELISGYVDNSDILQLKGNAEYRNADYGSAAESYSKALDLCPHNARLWHSKGMAEEMAGQYKKAETSYDRAVIMDFSNPEFWLSKAIVQEKRGDLPGAVQSLNRVISESPDNIFALVRKARIFVYAGKTKEALYFLDHALKIDKNNVKILDMKKNICKREGMLDNVAETCIAILKIDKKNVQAIIDLADIYQKTGKHEDALKVLNDASSDIGEIGLQMMKKNSARINGNTDLEIEACRAILKITPKDRNTKLELADALIRGGDNGAAMTVYDEMQSEDPKDAEVIVLRGKLRSIMGDDTGSLELYHEAVLKDPNNCDTLNQLANALFDSGDHREALNIISRSIEISPETAESHLLRSNIFMAMHDTGSALASLREALDHVSETGDIYLQIAEIREDMGDLDDALTSYDLAIRYGHDDSSTYYKRGRIQERLGNREAAKKSYSVSCQLDQSNIRAMKRIIEIRLEDKEYDEAKKELDRALKTYPFDAFLLLTRARLYVREGDKDKAIPIYRALSNRDDCDPEVANELESLVPAVKTVNVQREEPADIVSVDLPKERSGDDMQDLALSVLRRAYTTGKAISDENMLNELKIDGENKEKVLNYLSDIEEYGDIDVTSKEFEKMERLSKNVVIAEQLDDIDSNPLVSIPTAFMASRAETIDDAKRLIAYIYKVMNDDSEAIAFNDEVREAVSEASEMSGNITTYEIMRQFNVGVYTAHTISKLSKMDTKGTDMHI